MPPKPKKDSRTYLLDVLESAKIAVEYLGDSTTQQYHDDIKLQDAIVRRFEIIGEAAKRINDSIRSEFSDIEWTSYCGMRDILIHQYDGIDHELVYETVKTDLPPLITALEAYFVKNPIE